MTTTSTDLSRLVTELEPWQQSNLLAIIRRWQHGKVEYGDASHDRSIRDLVAETEQELVDMQAWGGILRRRLLTATHDVRLLEDVLDKARAVVRSQGSAGDRTALESALEAFDAPLEV